MAESGHLNLCTNRIHLVTFPHPRSLPTPWTPHPTHPSLAALLGLPASILAPQHQSCCCMELKNEGQGLPRRGALSRRAGDSGLKVLVSPASFQSFASAVSL